MPFDQYVKADPDGLICGGMLTKERFETVLWLKYMRPTAGKQWAAWQENRVVFTGAEEVMGILIPSLGRKWRWSLFPL